MGTEFQTGAGSLIPPESPITKSNKIFSPTIEANILALKNECGEGHPLEEVLWRYYVTAIYLEAKNLTREAFETQFFQLIQTPLSQQTTVHEIPHDQSIPVTGKKVSRRALLHGTGVLAKEAAIISATSSFLLAQYARLPKILDIVLAPEEQMNPDVATIEYNPKTFFHRAIAVIGNSNTGHSDKPGDMSNANDQHPPQMLLVNDMEKRFSDLHWQLFYFGENGADEKQVMEQIQSPLFQLINGQPVNFEKVIVIDNQREQNNQRRFNREIKVYITERTDPALRKLVGKYNNKKHLEDGHLYPFKLQSQQEVTILQTVLKKIQAIDIGKSSEGDTLVNAVQLNPEHPEYGKLLEIVENPEENIMKRAAALCLIFHLSADALDETADDETKLYLYLHDLNKQNVARKKPFIENIVSYKTPSLTGQKDFVMGQLESNGKTDYTVADIPQEPLFQEFVGGISKGINNAGAQGYEKAKLILRGRGEKFLARVIRIQAPVGLRYVDHQHFTDEGYEWLKEQIEKRTKYLGHTLEKLLKEAESVVSRRELFHQEAWNRFIV